MDVSNLFRHSGPTSTIFSPDSQWALSATGDRLVLRIASTLSVHKTWRCTLDQPLSAEASASCSLAFSPCSRRLLACFEAVKTVFAFSIDSHDEVARIQAGAEGCRGAAWISETCIAVWGESGLRITLWSLATGVSSVIKWPLHGPDRGWALRPADRRFLAVAERHEGRDAISLYDSQQNWHLVRHFKVATEDLRGLAWSPSSRYIAVWDGPLDYALHIYTPDGRLVTSFKPYGDESDPIASLGIRTVTWHPDGDFIAVAGFDGRVRILESLYWTTVADLCPMSKVASKGTTVFQEPQDWIARVHGNGIIPLDILPTPRTLAAAHSDPNKTSLGVSLMRWSPAGTALACVATSMPTMVHLYAFDAAAPARPARYRAKAIFVLSEPVCGLEWQPSADTGEMLVMASGTASVCLWNANESGIAEGMGVPSSTSFGVRNLAWSRDGTQLLLSDSTSFAVVYPA